VNRLDMKPTISERAVFTAFGEVDYQPVAGARHAPGGMV